MPIDIYDSFNMIVKSACDTLAGEICVQSLEISNVPKALAFKILSWTDRLYL